VFLVNSRHPLLCAPNPYLRTNWALFFRSYEGKLPSSFSTLLSSASAYSASPPVSVWGTVYTRELFPGTSSRPDQSNKVEQLTTTVTTRGSLTLLIATHVSILTCDTSRIGRPFPSQAYTTLCYRSYCYEPEASVHGLSPDTFSAQDSLSRPVSCYAFFK